MIDVVDDVVLRFRAKNAASQFKGSRDLINECGQQQELGEHAKGEEFKGRRGRKKGKTLLSQHPDLVFKKLLLILSMHLLVKKAYRKPKWLCLKVRKEKL